MMRFTALALLLASAHAGHDSWGCYDDWKTISSQFFGGTDPAYPVVDNYCIVPLAGSPLNGNFASYGTAEALKTKAIVGATILGAAGADGVPLLACVTSKGAYPNMVTNTMALGPDFQTCSSINMGTLQNYFSRKKDADGKYLGPETGSPAGATAILEANAGETNQDACNRLGALALANLKTQKGLLITDYTDFTKAVTLTSDAVAPCPRVGGPACPAGSTCPDGFTTRGGTQAGNEQFYQNKFGLYATTTKFPAGALAASFGKAAGDAIANTKCQTAKGAPANDGGLSVAGGGLMTAFISQQPADCKPGYWVGDPRKVPDHCCTAKSGANVWTGNQFADAGIGAAGGDKCAKAAPLGPAAKVNPVLVAGCAADGTLFYGEKCTGSDFTDAPGGNAGAFPACAAKGYSVDSGAVFDKTKCSCFTYFESPGPGCYVVAGPLSAQQNVLAHVKGCQDKNGNIVTPPKKTQDLSAAPKAGISGALVGAAGLAAIFRLAQ